MLWLLRKFWEIDIIGKIYILIILFIIIVATITNITRWNKAKELEKNNNISNSTIIQKY